MHDKPIEISQGSLGSLRAAVSSPSSKVVGAGGEGTATRGVRLSTEHCQSFVFINAASKLVTKLQATCDWLIQHSNRISKLSGLSSQMEMLD